MQSRGISDLRTLALIGRRVSVPLSPGCDVTNLIDSELGVSPVFSTKSFIPQLAYPVDPVVLAVLVPVIRADASVFDLLL